MNKIFASELVNISQNQTNKIMKYRAKITNWVDTFRRSYPEITVVTEPAGQFYGEFDSEESAELAEQINELVGKFQRREK